MLPAGHAVARALEHDVDVHTVDTNIPVVLEAEIDVLLDAEPEVAGAREAVRADFVIVDLESFVEDLEGPLATHRHVRRDLIVTANAELRDRAVGAGEHRLLTGELLDNAGRASDLVADRARVDVDADLRNADLAELVLTHQKGRPQPLDDRLGR